MPPTAAGERTGSSGSLTPLPVRAPQRLVSPAGALGIAAVLAVTALIVVRATAAFQPPSGPTVAHDAYEEVDLGQVSRDFAPEGGGLVRDPFMLHVIVVLNPKSADPAALKQQVERRRNLFRDIVWNEIVNLKSDADLRKPGTLESLRGEIRQRLNQELGGNEPIVRVIFPDRKLSERR